MAGGSFGFSRKLVMRCSRSIPITPNSAPASVRRQTSDRQISVVIAMLVNHPGIIHLVDVVAGKNHGVARRCLFNRVHVLIIASAVP